VPAVREVRESGRSSPAAKFTRQAAGATAKQTGGLLKALRRAPRASLPQPSRAKRRYVTAAGVLADLPPPEIARKLRVEDVAKKAPIDPVFSSHLFSDALSLSLHAVVARKILHDPSILERARSTLERWLSNQQPAPKPFIEWRRILTGTPQEIAAVALSMTEEATRLRSSSPLGCLLKSEERSAVYAAFGKLGSHTDLREESQVEVSKPLIGAGARAETLGAFLDDGEKACGKFTDEELRAAATFMEGPKPRTSSSAGRTGKPKKFARILAQAIKTFGSQEAAEAWLNSRVMGLGMKRPIDLMSTTESAQLVEDLLGRIDAGVFG
jgi:antitoxin Xre/MbcA/ParS-like protein